MIHKQKITPYRSLDDAQRVCFSRYPLARPYHRREKRGPPLRSNVCFFIILNGYINETVAHERDWATVNPHSVTAPETSCIVLLSFIASQSIWRKPLEQTALGGNTADRS